MKIITVIIILIPVLPPYLPIVKSCASRPLPAPAPGWEGGKSRQEVLAAAGISSLFDRKTERPKELDDFHPRAQVLGVQESFPVLEGQP